MVRLGFARRRAYTDSSHMKINIALAFSILGVIAAAPTASAQVQLTMQGGHVTLSAKDATIRQILAEWERVGETKVVNGERSPGGLFTLELPDMPEQQALDIILRSASGVLFAPRTEAAAGNVSNFAQIILMPPSIAPPPPPVLGLDAGAASVRAADGLPAAAPVPAATTASAAAVPAAAAVPTTAARVGR